MSLTELTSIIAAVEMICFEVIVVAICIILIVLAVDWLDKKTSYRNTIIENTNNE